jgi:hypothetical protein
MSTLVAALIFWKAVTTPCINGKLVLKDHKATKSLFDKIKPFMYDTEVTPCLRVRSMFAHTCTYAMLCPFVNAKYVITFLVRSLIFDKNWQF